MKNKSLFYEVRKGIFDENPTFVQLLGMCPTLAVTTSVKNGLGMGLSATAVLVGSNVAVSLLRHIIPRKIRIASYVVLIAGFVSAIEMLLKAFLPSVSRSLGLFIPLIVVNCIILARAEAFASSHPPIRSALDGLGMGLGFTLSLTLISAVRELLGNGTLFGYQLSGVFGQPARFFVLPPGGFLALGLIMGFLHAMAARKKGANK